MHLRGHSIVTAAYSDARCLRPSSYSQLANSGLSTFPHSCSKDWIRLSCRWFLCRIKDVIIHDGGGYGVGFSVQEI